jgi:autotransporter-associated beta strand protein
MQLANVNDFPDGAAFNSLTITGDGYLLNGNAVTLSSGVAADVFNNSTIALPLNGTGGVTKSGSGRLTLAAANTYTGLTTINAGAIQIQTNTALGATGPGNGTVIADPATLIVATDGLVAAEPITFGAGGVRTTNSTDATITGPLTIPADAQIAAGLFSVITVMSGVSQTGGSRGLRLNGDITFAAGSVTTVTGTTVVQGTFTADGAGPFGPVQVISGVLQGNGAVGPVFVAQGTLSPGISFGTGTNTTGTLTTGGVTLADSGSNSLQAAFTFDAGGHDILNVNGPVQVGGQLFTQFAASFTATAGAHYLLIGNDGNDPVVGTFRQLPEGAGVAVFDNLALTITYHGGDGNDVELVAGSAGSLRRYAVGAGPGGLPGVNVFDANGTLVRSFLAYEASFRGGVNVATADINRDSLPDIVTAPGFGGGPLVRVWDGATGAMTMQFLAYDAAFRGGVSLSVGLVNADQNLDIITGAGPTGGPHVKAFDGLNAFPLLSFFAYAANFTGGVSVAAGDATTVSIRGEITPGAIITGAGPGGGPHVRVFNAVSGAPTGQEFFAYDASFTGGINVAYDAGRPFGNQRTIITAPKAGGGPLVRGFDVNGVPRFAFNAYDANFRGGVSVAVQILNPTGVASIITGAGPGGGPHLRVWNATGTMLERQFMAFDPAFTGGVFVG